MIRWLTMIAVLAIQLVAARAEDAPRPEEYLPGVTLSQGITEITGVAISPLLGVSAVGAWQYWKAPQERRAALPWYAQPWAWGTGMALLALCFLKDSLGTAVPGILKKPFDMLELFENKASALVASGAFVPLVAEQMAKHFHETAVPAASLAGGVVAMVDLSWLMVPSAVIAFLLVWVCSHAINVMIILSPFSTLDALLKLMRAALLALVAVLYALAPWVGAVFCLCLIALAIWLAPAAMRLMIFGASFSADVLLPWRARVSIESPHAFTLRRLGGVPARTRGRLLRTEAGGVAFQYRRWVVGNRRTVALEEGGYQLEQGMLAPSLVQSAADGPATKWLLFLPRAKGHELSITRHFGFPPVRDHALRRGLKAMRDWLGGLIRGDGRRLAS